MTCCYAKAYLKCKYSRNEHAQLIFKIDQYIKKIQYHSVYIIFILIEPIHYEVFLRIWTLQIIK